MKKTIISIIISFLFVDTIAQNAKVIDSPSGTVISNAGGTDIPYSASILDIRSSTRGVLLPRMSTGSRDAIGSPLAGLLLYNSTTNQFNYHDGAAWQQAFFGNQWNVNGAKYYYNGGNVGIGVADPLYKLDISGNIHTASNGFIDGSLSVGGNAIAPNFKMQVNDGSLATYNTADDKFWALSYNSTSNYLHLNEDNISRVYFQNGGYVGIGVSPLYPLDVSGTIHSSNNLRADGSAYVNQNAYIDGSADIGGAAYVNGGKGVVHNLSGSTNTKIARFVTPQPAEWGVGSEEYPIPAHGSHIITIDLPDGFTSAPAVIVASQHSSGGDVGELYRAILVIYGCSTTQCTGKIINTDNSAMDYWVRWNLIAVGN